MNGHITCYSEVDLGTRFSVYLPAVHGDSTREIDVRVPDQGACRGTETVLLVEDDFEVRQLVYRALVNSATVLEAVDGYDAAQLSESTWNPYTCW